MIQYLPKLALLGLLFLGLIPGFSGLFLIEAAIAMVILGGASSIANSKGLVPGTSGYRNRLTIESAKTNLEVDRINRVRTKINFLESQDVDRILALDPPKSDAAE
jgi:hypothetical protein